MGCKSLIHLLLQQAASVIVGQADLVHGEDGSIIQHRNRLLVDVQLLLGVLVFLLPWAPLSLRALVMPMHVYSGLLIFGTVIATVLMGVTEKLIFGV